MSNMVEHTFCCGLENINIRGADSVEGKLMLSFDFDGKFKFETEKMRSAELMRFDMTSNF